MAAKLSALTAIEPTQNLAPPINLRRCRVFHGITSLSGASRETRAEKNVKTAYSLTVSAIRFAVSSAIKRLHTYIF